MTDSKDKRYDRQLRIWGQEGQQRLEKSRVLLLNCGPTGSETLKNLVLGGIGAFTIIDDNKVAAADLGNNFLLDAESLGESRAASVTRLLKELNESVNGSYVEDTPEAWIESQAKTLDFNLVIATQMRECDVRKLEAICREKGTRLLVVRSYGLVGSLRASVAEHQVVESKPDSRVEDLRLHQPFPALAQYAASIDIDVLPDHQHRHLPYVAILLIAAQRWRQQHTGAPPANSIERAAFKDLIRSMRRPDPDIPGAFMEEENFDEALKAAYHVWTPAQVPPELRAIFADESASPTPSSDNFWLLIAALKAFVESEGGGTLPLEGSIPDMTATTEAYLELQRIYRERAERDVAAVQTHLAHILKGLGRSADAVPTSAVRQLCKNAHDVRVLRYRTLQQETSPELSKSMVLHQALSQEHTAANASLYVLLRAADKFHAAHGRYPGAYDDELEDDMPKLKSLCSQLLTEAGINNAGIDDDYVHEMCRFGASELHLVAAVMGGMAAQEAIKLITQQFVPVAGTLIYNAMASTTSFMEL